MRGWRPHTIQQGCWGRPTDFVKWNGLCAFKVRTILCGVYTLALKLNQKHETTSFSDRDRLVGYWLKYSRKGTFLLWKTIWVCNSWKWTNGLLCSRKLSIKTIMFYAKMSIALDRLLNAFQNNMESTGITITTACWTSHSICVLLKKFYWPSAWILLDLHATQLLVWCKLG